MVGQKIAPILTTAATTVSRFYISLSTSVQQTRYTQFRQLWSCWKVEHTHRHTETLEQVPEVLVDIHSQVTECIESVLLVTCSLIEQWLLLT